MTAEAVYRQSQSPSKRNSVMETGDSDDVGDTEAENLWSSLLGKLSKQKSVNLRNS